MAKLPSGVSAAVTTISLRDGRDGNGHHRHEQIRKGHVPDEIAPGQEQGCNKQNEEGQPTGKMIHLRDERRRQLLNAGQKAANAPDFRRRTGGGDEAARGSSI